MLAVAYLNDGQVTFHVEWRSTTFFAAAVIAWISSCLPDKAQSNASGPGTSITPKRATAHDKQLFSKFRQAIDQRTLEFLGSQDLASSFLVNDLQGLREVSGGFIGPNYHFDDEDLQTAFAPLLAKIKNFSAEVALKTQQTGLMIKMYWDYKNEHASRARAEALNDLGDELYRALNDFIPIARRQLDD